MSTKQKILGWIIAIFAIVILNVIFWGTKHVETKNITTIENTISSIGGIVIEYKKLSDSNKDRSPFGAEYYHRHNSLYKVTFTWVDDREYIAWFRSNDIVGQSFEEDTEITRRTGYPPAWIFEDNINHR
ncbi:hypothetical protein [Chengkuizengella marina]|uniref:DUF3139 domain-containing protein n=1 Tax=Chengkuizengella marina TaxID=2507566 RepID=A0A6N9Q8P1_9BACL|nr:hypothetical protein [Chengkuizengella marina]NBI31237.1 hypothetical protein [Chengkuizengella marina]